ncbi:ATP-binding cassette domain-containing protein [Desulfovibrio ferrophilus]|uniref:ABC transporter n=1 Tax=Desulfovibrio ferrophilus TaxID=241368 RepID=A0A2Z6AY79_9BACT|nr:ATP-binding cassette domain-containing protein [Desulfovibrio ferrophilus]BBD08224.1 ABC transporter [Desulfovibrio ferrophilus]
MTLCVNIRKQLPQFTLKVSLSCLPGQLTAIVGPSGAGKSTLMRIIAGLERPDRGVVTLGDTVFVDTANDIFLPPQKRGLGLVFQDYPLFPHLSVRNNVGFATKDEQRIDELLDIFGVAHLADKRPGAVSGGERQRVAFCQALARNPVLLLLDEPFSALDVDTRRSLRCELRDLKNSLTVPILHVTHDLEEAAYLADQTIPLERGCLSENWLTRVAPGCSNDLSAFMPQP